VTDILKGLSAGGWSFLVSWVFPSALYSSLFAVLVFPNLKLQSAIILAFIAIGLGLLLSATSTVLYRILEGYYLLPGSVRKWKMQRQLNRKHKYLRKLERSREDAGESDRNGARTANSIDIALISEKLHRFPVDDSQVAPTRLANGIRAFETYGYDRFSLDSQIFWSELIAVAPKPLRDAEDQARASVNLFVSLIYLSVAFGVASFFAALRMNVNEGRLLLFGVLALILSPVWYEFAVLSTSNWHSAVQALVNTGRRELAFRLGLQLPKKFADERLMWQRLTWFVYDNANWGHQLNDFREDPESKDSRCLRSEEQRVNGARGQLIKGFRATITAWMNRSGGRG
jgi:hypothetical protein